VNETAAGSGISFRRRNRASADFPARKLGVSLFGF
jgi:hypothetical protein